MAEMGTGLRRCGRLFDVLTCPRHLINLVIGSEHYSSLPPGVITPPASAEVTAFIAAAMSWAFSPRALSRGSTLDRRQSELHHAIAAGRQNAFEAQPHRARGSPTSASSTALRVKAAASPLSKAAAAIVVLLRQPTRRPVGLPDWPV
jgi:hypothetical protein